MSFVKILDIDVDLLRKAANKDFMVELLHEVESKLASLDDMKGGSYVKPDIIQLIKSIETNKVKFLRGDISAKRLYCDVDYALSLFKIKHPGFDYMNDPAINAYFSPDPSSSLRG
jgi:hypothetical protein